MPDFIVEHGVKTAFALMVGFLTFAVKNLYSKIQKEKADRLNQSTAESMEQQLIKEGVLAILHDKVYTLCQTLIVEGVVTVGDINNLEYIYKSYHALGGNGTGTELYKRVKKLPIKTGEMR